MTKKLRKEIYRTQSEFRNIFPEKPSVEDDIFEEIEYTKALINSLDTVKLEREKANKLLQKVKSTLALPNLVEI